MSPSSPHRRLGEFAMITKLFAPLAARAEGAFGLTDDAAALSVPAGHELVVTVDALVEGVHFLSHDPADLIARKALRVNLSDLAAKGAEARHYLLTLSLPDWVDDSWLARFAKGLGEDQARYGVSLIGGDTTSTPGPLTLSITAIGIAPARRIIRRLGANPGDLVFVSGTIGDAGAGLVLLQGGEAALGEADKSFLIARYRLPEPRGALGRRLIGLASAALDVSDGLLADLGHLADVSGVRILVDGPRLPLSPAYVTLNGNAMDAIARAATAGDDYEIAFTAPAKLRSAIAAAANEAKVAVREIGRVEDGEGVVLLDANGQRVPVQRAGYTHF
jgi:thiamine-monophosphate kinase